MTSNNEHIQNLKTAIKNKIDSIIQTHNGDTLSHADIRAELDDIGDYLVYLSEVDINDLIDKALIREEASSVNTLQMGLLLDDLANEIAKE